MKSRVYILQNQRGKYYMGITSQGLKQRLRYHNNGYVASTKFGRPWQLIHFEEYQNMVDARKREKQIKSWKCGNAFKKLLRNHKNLAG